MEKASFVLWKMVLVLAFVFISGCNTDSGDLSEPTQNKRLTYTQHQDDEAGIHDKEAAIPYGAGMVYYVGPTKSLDAVNCEIVNTGTVFENVKEIPQTDWTATTVAEVGSNYFIRVKDGTYGRLTITDITSRWSSSQPSITVYFADVRFQYPHTSK